MKKKKRDPQKTRQSLIDAMVALVLKQGYNATTVDEICREAGATKGSFFHHFESKEAVGRAAIEWWSQMGTDLYSAAWTGEDNDPLKQLYTMIGIMESFISGEDNPCLCVIGMMSQELAGVNSEMRDLCGRELKIWTDNTTRLLAEAKAHHVPKTDFDPEQVAWFLNSIWQGSMLVAKTQQRQQIIVDNLKQARFYISSLFGERP